MTRVNLGTLLLVACLACGDGGGNGSEPSLPRRGDPARGQVGNVLITDGVKDIDGVHDEVWIGFDQQQAWDDFVALQQRLSAIGGVAWIGGHFVAEPHHHLGFYFDPDTTNAAEVTAETNEISIDLLKQDPSAWEQLQSGAWVVPAIVVRLVSDEGS